MKKVGLLTFHASHNYGSMLQNYALQQTLIKLGFYPETINLRTETQKEIYNFFAPFSQMRDKKHAVRKLIFYPWKKQLDKKYRLFEEFLNKELNLSREVQSYDEIKELSYYDEYIVGSDQCWNVNADDFDWAYFLGFIPDKYRRISYAVSMGPNPSESIKVRKEISYKIAMELKKFTAISVRDENTRNVISEIEKNKHSIEVHVDPTLLLSSEEWESKMPKERLIKEPYVFFYNPYWRADAFEQAYELGKLTSLKVVTSVPNMIGLFKYPSFEKVFETGPWEFLNLVKNADYVIGGSFHLIVFCVLFHKRFVAVNGMNDSRVSQLLKSIGLENYASKDGDVKAVLNQLSSIDFAKAKSWRLMEEQRSIEYLKNYLL